MPRRPPAPCPRNGCPARSDHPPPEHPCPLELTPLACALDHTARRAEQHRMHDATRPSPRARGYDDRWNTTRGDHLRRYPRCQWPACGAPAVDVHHLDELGPLGPRGHDHDNLASLCHAHHSEVTGRSRKAAAWRLRRRGGAP